MAVQTLQQRMTIRIPVVISCCALAETCEEIRTVFFMARRRKGLAINGIVVLNKPQGITSNAALQRVRHVLDAQKAGHTGALDPLATGVLPLCFGEATKFSQILLDADKEYVTRARLGIKTDSADADGEIIEKKPVPTTLGDAELEVILNCFRGSIMQVPSMYSALKYKGVPLYKLAREGVEVKRDARPVNIYELELIDVELPFISLRVRCSKGTYIRNLVEDIGDRLGCGAHVAALHRTQSGPFRIEQAKAWGIFESGERISEEFGQEGQEVLLPVESAVESFPKIILNQDDTGSIIRGQTVKISPLDIPPVAQSLPYRVRLYQGEEHLFLGLGELNGKNELKASRLLNTDALSVKPWRNI